MRQEESFFGEKELVLVYIAKKLREARKLEEKLDELGIHYLVEADTYRGGVLFVRELVGAFFYVKEEEAAAARAAVASVGFKPYEPLDA